MDENSNEELLALPDCIACSPTSVDKFDMPSAEILFTQREEEKKCEEELQELLSSFEVLGKAATENCKQVTKSRSIIPTATYMLEGLIKSEILRQCDVTFLKSHLKLLKTENNEMINSTTYTMLKDIKNCILQNEASSFPEDDMLVLLCWLAAAIIWDKPKTKLAQEVFECLLKEQQPKTIELLGTALCEVLTDIPYLLYASEAIYGKTPQQENLSKIFLSKAFNYLIPDADVELKVPLICEQIEIAWRNLDSSKQYLVLVLLSRMVARERNCVSNKALQDLLSVVTQTQSFHNKLSPDYIKVRIVANKLHVLFLSKEDTVNYR